MANIPKTETKDNDKDDPMAAEKKWKLFTDEDYMNGTMKCQVPVRSLFSYLGVPKIPMFLTNEPKKTTLAEMTREMVDKNLGAYVTIQIGNRTFNCIPKLIKCYSIWFARQNVEVEGFIFNEDDVSPVAFEFIYEWMRFKTPLDLIKVIKVMQASRFLGVDLLEEDCWKILSQEGVREKIAFRLFQETVNLPTLKDVNKLMLSRVRGYFLALVGSKEFQDLKLKEVLNLLKSDTIGVNSEIEVFFAAIRWMSKNSKQRVGYMSEIMDCVRFSLMTTSFLFSIRDSNLWPKDGQAICSPDHVLVQFRQDPKITQKVYEAIAYIGVQWQKNNSDMEVDVLAGSAEYEKPLISPRRWIYQHKCSYHKSKLTFPYAHDFSHNDFIDFVASIQKDWLTDEPPVDAFRDVEFDGILQLRRDTC